jgi:hypothetical protein
MGALVKLATAVAAVTIGSVLAFAPRPALASWGPSVPHCSAGEGHHCYATSYRNIKKYGGVLASIDFVDTTSADVTSFAFVDEEEWIAWPETTSYGWIETGQADGSPYGCCEEHPFWAQQTPGGVYSEYTSPGTVPLNSYNHYVIYDAESNGTYHIYWGCCEVHSISGRPKYLYEQEAGIEAATEARPYQWGRQEVAASDGGEWTPWSGDSWFRSPGICMTSNVDSSAAGNIMWGTLGSPPDEEC